VRGSSSVESELRRTLEHYWGQLPAPSGASISSTDIAISLGAGTVRLGVDSDRHRHLLVPIADDAPEVSDRTSSGVRLTTRPLSSGDGSRRYADLECARPDLSGVFTGLAADVCLALLAGPVDPGVAVATHLDDWRALLGAGSRPWTTPRLGGLTAELLVLDQLLALNGHAASYWSGPLGEAQDFRSSRHAIEVKASLTREGRLIRIHGTDQLEPPAGGALGLVWFRLRPVGAGEGIGLVELIERCLERGGAAAVLDRLDRLGLPATSEPDIAAARFEVVEQRWYRVDDAFPAIHPGRFLGHAVPAGVGAVEYLVDLDVVAAEPDPVEDLLTTFLEQR
jgi:putative PD-(D/E)XK family protein DUF4420